MRPRASTFAPIALALLVAAGFAAAEWTLLGGRLGFPLDDAWIHLAFAERLATGHGLAYNPGEPVAGSTAPLWTALVAVLVTLPGNPVVWVKLLGAALFAGVVDASARLARALGLDGQLPLLAAVLVALTPWLPWAALGGMEVPLFTLLTLWGMILHAAERAQPRRPPLSLGVLGLAVLARPEGALLLLLALADRLLMLRREPDGGLRLTSPDRAAAARGLGLAAAALLPALAALAWATGAVLPSTLGAKAAVGGGALPDLRYLYTVLGIFFQSQPIATLLAGAGVLRLAEAAGGRRDRGLLPALWLLALPLAYSWLSPAGGSPLVGNFGRYFFPLFPPLVVLAVLGLERSARRLGPAIAAGRLRLPLRALAAVLLLAPCVPALLTGTGRYAQSVANVEDGDVALAHWVRRHLPPEAVLAVQDVGALGYFTDNRLLDLAGIVTPEIQTAVRRTMSPGDPLGRRGMEGFLAERRPDYLITYPAWYPEIAGDRDRFPVLHAIAVADNIALAGDLLVVRATPWTRHPPRP